MQAASVSKDDGDRKAKNAAPSLSGTSTLTAGTTAQSSQWQWTGKDVATVGISVLALLVSFNSWRFNKHTFRQTRLRATYHALVTEPALDQIPTCADDLVKELSSCAANVESIIRASRTVAELNEAMMKAAERLKNSVQPIRTFLTVALRAWGDSAHLEDVSDAIDEWEANVADEINKWRSTPISVDDLCVTIRDGEAALLRVIVAKDKDEHVGGKESKAPSIFTRAKAGIVGLKVGIATGRISGSR